MCRLPTIRSTAAGLPTSIEGPQIRDCFRVGDNPTGVGWTIPTTPYLGSLTLICTELTLGEPSGTVAGVTTLYRSQWVALTALVVAALCPAVSFAQQIAASQVPASVKGGVQAKFPGAKVTEWKLKGKDYEAEFTLNKIDIAAKFDATGKWLETETTIALQEVPPAIRDKFASQFAGYKVVETQSLQRGDGSGLIYEIHFENSKEVVKAQFAADGKALERSAKAKAAKGK